MDWSRFRRFSRPTAWCVAVLLTLTWGARPGWAQRIITEAEQIITVSMGESALLVETAGTLQRFTLGDPNVADAVVLSPTELLVTGKQLGTTSLFVWDAQGRVRVYSVQVTADAPALERFLRELFPSDEIRVTASGNTVTLSGQVSSSYVALQAAEIAQGTGATIIDRLQAPPARQVLLQVRFAEVGRTAAKEMATRLAGRNVDDLDVNHESDFPLGEEVIETVSDGLMRLFLLNPDADFEAIIRLLKSKGEFKSLAEPNLLTIPGQEASFLAGGEFPFPTVQGGQTNAVSIVFKEFGVRLRFTPTVTESGTIRLRVAPEVSSLDFANGLAFGGFVIPTLLSRKAETTVELREGQYLAIAGLLDNTISDNVTKIPILGDIPILGAFFRSKDAAQSRTELLVVVSPRLVDATDTSPELPTGEPETWKWDGSLRRQNR